MNTTFKPLPTIGVLGSGPVGQGIAVLLSRADYLVSLGTRHPESTKLDSLPAQVRRTTFRDAAQADYVFLAVLHSASRDLVTSLADNLKGKLLVDTDNAWLPGHARAAGLTGSLTEGSWMASVLPEVHVARTFSHVDWDKLVVAATDQPNIWAAGYAADDPDATEQLETLIRAMRYVPLRCSHRVRQGHRRRRRPGVVVGARPACHSMAGRPRVRSGCARHRGRGPPSSGRSVTTLRGAQ